MPKQTPPPMLRAIDAGRKICILADLAFGHQVSPNQVPMEGTTKLDLKDVEIAQRHGYQIKLLGRCRGWRVAIGPLMWRLTSFLRKIPCPMSMTFSTQLLCAATPPAMSCSAARAPVNCRRLLLCSRCYGMHSGAAASPGDWLESR